MIQRRFSVLAAILVFTFLFAQTVGAELVTNGGFETGNFTGWSTTPAPGGSLFGVSTGDPHSGSYAAYFGAVGSSDDTITQATISTTPGAFYTFSFWLEHESSNQANDFHAGWNGTSVLDLVNANAFGYTQYTFNVQATGASSTISFAGREVPSFYNLDDVSVSAVPEPSILLLLGSGFVGLIGLGRRIIR